MVMFFKWQIFYQCNTVDVVEDSHQQLKIRIVIAIFPKIFKHKKFFTMEKVFLFTNWMIPQMEMINPQRESFGPQILIFLFLHNHNKLENEEILKEFLSLQKSKKIFNHVMSRMIFSTRQTAQTFNSTCRTRRKHFNSKLHLTKAF